MISYSLILRSQTDQPVNSKQLYTSSARILIPMSTYELYANSLDYFLRSYMGLSEYPRCSYPGKRKHYNIILYYFNHLKSSKLSWGHLVVKPILWLPYPMFSLSFCACCWCLVRNVRLTKAPPFIEIMNCPINHNCDILEHRVLVSHFTNSKLFVTPGRTKHACYRFDAYGYFMFG